MQGPFAKNQTIKHDQYALLTCIRHDYVTNVHVKRPVR